MQISFEAYEQLFYNDGSQLGKEATLNGNTDSTLFSSIIKMYEAIDQLNESLETASKRQSNPIHCRKGCSWCCHQPVFANTYELKYLLYFIQKQFTEKEIDEVTAKAKSKNTITSKLEEKQLLNYKSSCPLLKDGTCSAYPARPMACRIYLSTNVGTCLEFYQNPENEKNYPALLEFPLQAGRMMNEGFMAALSEGGVKTEEFRLEEGLTGKELGI